MTYDHLRRANCPVSEPTERRGYVNSHARQDYSPPDTSPRSSAITGAHRVGDGRRAAQDLLAAGGFKEQMCEWQDDT